MTERILARLGSPRWLWIGLWGSLAIVQPFVAWLGVNLAGEPGRVHIEDLFGAQIAVAYVVVLVLWAVGHLARGSAALQPDLARLTGAAWSGHLVAGAASVIGPVVLTLGIAVISVADAWIHLGPLPAFLRVPVGIATTFPMMVFVWTYLELLRGLNELGSRRLTFDSYPPDRSLGLGRVGALAFQGFLLLFAAAAPLMLFDFTTLLLALAVVVVSVPIFFLSMWRLHVQMAQGKAKYLDQARAAYRQAYQPYREDQSAEMLQAQAPLLSAAQALEDRAEKIRTWPVDERLFRVMGFVVTVAATTIIGRIILLAIAK